MTDEQAWPNDIEEAEVMVREKPLEKKKRKSIWSFFGHRAPRSEIVFVCQILIIYVVVSVSLYNLTREGGGPDKLWVALLSSCLGYLLPNPSIDPR